MCFRIYLTLYVNNKFFSSNVVLVGGKKMCAERFSRVCILTAGIVGNYIRLT